VAEGQGGERRGHAVLFEVEVNAARSGSVVSDAAPPIALRRANSLSMAHASPFGSLVSLGAADGSRPLNKPPLVVAFLQRGQQLVLGLCRPHGLERYRQDIRCEGERACVDKRDATVVLDGFGYLGALSPKGAFAVG
jgi:hypothetical protein